MYADHPINDFIRTYLFSHFYPKPVWLSIDFKLTSESHLFNWLHGRIWAWNKELFTYQNTVDVNPDVRWYWTANKLPNHIITYSLSSFKMESWDIIKLSDLCLLGEGVALSDAEYNQHENQREINIR